MVPGAEARGQKTESGDYKGIYSWQVTLDKEWYMPGEQVVATVYINRLAKATDTDHEDAKVQVESDLFGLPRPSSAAYSFTRGEDFAKTMELTATIPNGVTPGNYDLMFHFTGKHTALGAFIDSFDDKFVTVSLEVKSSEGAAPTAEATPTPTPMPEITPTPTPSPTPEITPAPIPSPTPVASPTPTRSTKTSNGEFQNIYLWSVTLDKEWYCTGEQFKPSAYINRDSRATDTDHEDLKIYAKSMELFGATTPTSYPLASFDTGQDFKHTFPISSTIPSSASPGTYDVEFHFAGKYWLIWPAYDVFDDLFTTVSVEVRQC
jgi:hypothetical protein